MGSPLARLSFRDFLGLASGDKVPDEKTIWAFKENKLIKEDRGGEKHFGYKNHAKVDKGCKFVKKSVKRVMRRLGMKDRMIKRNTRGKKNQQPTRVNC